MYDERNLGLNQTIIETFNLNTAPSNTICCSNPLQKETTHQFLSLLIHFIYALITLHIWWYKYQQL